MCRTKTSLHRFCYGSLDRYERSLLSLILVIHPLNTQVVLTQHREKVHQLLLKLTVRAHGSDQVTLTKQFLLTDLGVIVTVHILTCRRWNISFLSLSYKVPLLRGSQCLSLFFLCIQTHCYIHMHVPAY